MAMSPSDQERTAPAAAESTNGTPAEQGSRDSRFWEQLDKSRTVYYILFFAMIAVAIGAGLSAIQRRGSVGPVLVLVYYVLAVAFLVIFLRTARRLDYSTGWLLVMAVLILLPLPLVPILTIAVVDRGMGELIEKRSLHSAFRREAVGSDQPRVDPLAYLSLVLFMFPYFGLPLALLALYRIGKSNGARTGRGLAWTGVGLNAVVLAVIIGLYLAPSLISRF